MRQTKVEKVRLEREESQATTVTALIIPIIKQYLFKIINLLDWPKPRESNIIRRWQSLVLIQSRWKAKMRQTSMPRSKPIDLNSQLTLAAISLIRLCKNISLVELVREQHASSSQIIDGHSSKLLQCQLEINSRWTVCRSIRLKELNSKRMIG